MATITRMYDSYEDARAVVQDLEAAGIPRDNISLVAQNADGRVPASTATTDRTVAGTTGSTVDPADRDDSSAEAGAKRGAVIGGGIGTGVGLLTGLGIMAIPGVGPVVAAGWLATMLAGLATGAAGGGLIGSLTGAGVSEDEAHVYAEGVRRGGTLVTVRTESAADVAQAEAVLDKRSTLTWQDRRATYGETWKGFDETHAIPPNPPSTRVSG